MIGQLCGTLLAKDPPFVLIDVGGVGYEVQVSMNTLFKLPDTGQACTLCIHMAVRDDGHYLYGFLDKQERLLFRNLLKVSGVGPKLALAILSGSDMMHFVRTIMDNDCASLQRIPGVGKKTAQRLLVEMRDLLAGWQTEGAPITKQSDAVQEAINAMISLGYKPTEAARAVKQLETQDKSCESLLREALKGMQS